MGPKKHSRIWWEAIRSYRRKGYDPAGTRTHGGRVEYKELFNLKGDAEFFVEIVEELYPWVGYGTELMIVEAGSKYEVQGFRNKDYM